MGTPVLVLVEDESAVDKFKDYQPSAAGGSGPAKADQPQTATPSSAAPGIGHIQILREQPLLTAPEMLARQQRMTCINLR